MTRPGELVVHVVDLLRQPGVRRPLERHVVLDGLAITSAAVPDGAEVDLDLVLEATGADIVVEGTIRAPWRGACRRCLDPVDGTLEVAVREIFERHPTEGETYQRGEDTIDLEPLVREHVLLALPLAPLCATDCAGPAPEVFPTGPADDAGVPDGAGSGDSSTGGGEDPPRDPRWAALDALRFDP